jgi:geranylgeranyl diphosphate synthase type II
LTEYLESRRAAVDAALEACLPAVPEVPELLAAAMYYAVFPGGKRLRPTLVLLAAEAAGGDDSLAMPAACAVELVHCYSLAHDDLPAMDDDDLRRGRPTCHKKFGDAMAILAGDALLTLAFETLSRQDAAPELAAASCRELASAVGARGMVGGQVDDMAASEGGTGNRLTVEVLKSIHVRKTGALLRACLRLGGLAADASAEAMRALDGYGQKIGLAFQITDDLLDVCGAESATGKRVGKDKGRGKLTFPGVVGVDESRRMACDLFRGACEQLGPLGSRAGRLKELAQFIVERDR